MNFSKILFNKLPFRFFFSSLILTSVLTGAAKASDFDGDKKDDFVVFRQFGQGDTNVTQGNWWILKSSDGTTLHRPFGVAGDIPIGESDFDFDGKDDIVVWRPSTGTWLVLKSSSNFNTSFSRAFGTGGDVPIGGLDFDRDGKDDMVVYRPSDRTWYVYRSSSNFTTFFGQQWGLGGDIPVGGSK